MHASPSSGYPHFVSRPSIGVRVYRTVGSFEYGTGKVTVVETSNPLENPLPNFVSYAALGDWRPRRAPVGMLVTVVLRAMDVRQIHLVYADAPFRRIAGDPRITVVVGRWLLACGLFTEHSPDRNDAGDRWAEAVGGVIPPRDPMQTTGQAEQDGATALTRLNELFGVG